MPTLTACEGNLNNPGFNVSYAWTPAALYVLVKNAAQQVGMRQYLPQDHMVLNESRRYGSSFAE